MLRKYLRNLEWKTANLFLLLLSWAKGFSSYHQQMSRLMFKPTYQQAIGCLTYIATATRPDIAAAVGVLSQYISRPSKDHWIGVKRVLRYLKGTLNYSVWSEIFSS